MDWLARLAAAQVPWKLVGIAAGALLLIAAVLAFIDRAFDETEEKGAVVERNQQLEQVIIQVEKADEARSEVVQHDDTGGRVRFCQCLRTARTPASCERLLRGREAYLCGTRP